MKLQYVDADADADVGRAMQTDKEKSATRSRAEAASVVGIMGIAPLGSGWGALNHGCFISGNSENRTHGNFACATG
ncbi:MAG: hypothetical protein ABGY42_05935 [bacterium]